MSAVENFTEEAKRLHSKLANDAFADQRQMALARFQQTGFPTLRQEHWKYTDLRNISKKSFTLLEASNNLTTEHLNSARFDELDCHELIFHNGIYQSSLSRIEDIQDNVLIQDLATALLEHEDIVSRHLNQSDNERTTAFTALNTSFLKQGCFIYIPDNTVVEKPINLLYLSGLNDDMPSSQPRNIIVLGENAEATIIESYIGLDESVYFTNTVTELTLEANSFCQHYKLQQESHKAFHIGSLKVSQNKDSHLQSHSISFGAALARNDIHSLLNGSGSSILMNGLYMATGKQHIDNHTLVDHLVPQTKSNQVYRGVLNGFGRGVFNGKVVVHKDAQKTEADQANANLLLSDTAEVDTKPELEIYADDVKCSHGATVGQLDQNMMFYLRSRAIEEETAKSLLTYAFADEVISKIAFLPIRKRLEHLVIGKLPDADLIQDFVHESPHE